jgi:perosamine synthetase
MSLKIPLSQPDLTQREIDAVADVMRSGTLSIGPKLEEFESHVARISGRSHAVGVSNGTCGLHLCMLAANIGPGDEVITTPFSFVASANCILYVGAKPVFVDIDTKSLNLDPTRIEAAITPRTKGIVAVEAFGHPGGMLEVEAIARRNELTLIEDCCEGFGGAVGSDATPSRGGKRPIGSFGRAGVFGFYPNKQITTGEGGMIVTDDIRFAETCRALRNQGREGMSWLAHQRLGYNYRLTEIAAAIGIVQCERLEEILDRRRQVALMYIERLMTSKFVTLPTLGDHDHVSWFVFVVRLNDLFEPGDRDEVMRDLRASGVGCNNYFPPIHLQPYVREQLGHAEGSFPVTEYVAARTLALPFFGAMTAAQVNDACTRLEAALEKVLMNKGR